MIGRGVDIPDNRGGAYHHRVDTRDDYLAWCDAHVGAHHTQEGLSAHEDHRLGDWRAQRASWIVLRKWRMDVGS